MALYGSTVIAGILVWCGGSDGYTRARRIICILGGGQHSPKPLPPQHSGMLIYLSLITIKGPPNEKIVANILVGPHVENKAHNIEKKNSKKVPNREKILRGGSHRRPHGGGRVSARPSGKSI